MIYADKAIKITEPEIDNGEEAYPIWRSAIMIKASLFLIEKKKDEAISCYQELAKVATSKVDVFYVMEAYRMIAFVEYKRKKLDKTWQASIFSLQAGTNLPLEIRRASTYLHAAAVAYQVV